MRRATTGVDSSFLGEAYHVIVNPSDVTAAAAAFPFPLTRPLGAPDHLPRPHPACRHERRSCSRRHPTFTQSTTQFFHSREPLYLLNRAPRPPVRDLTVESFVAGPGMEADPSALR